MKFPIVNGSVNNDLGTLPRNSSHGICDRFANLLTFVVQSIQKSTDHRWTIFICSLIFFFTTDRNFGVNDLPDNSELPFVSASSFIARQFWVAKNLLRILFIPTNYHFQLSCSLIGASILDVFFFYKTTSILITRSLKNNVSTPKWTTRKDLILFSNCTICYD